MDENKKLSPTQTAAVDRFVAVYTQYVAATKPIRQLRAEWNEVTNDNTYYLVNDLIRSAQKQILSKKVKGRTPWVVEKAVEEPMEDLKDSSLTSPDELRKSLQYKFEDNEDNDDNSLEKILVSVAENVEEFLQSSGPEALVDQLREKLEGEYGAVQDLRDEAERLKHPFKDDDETYQSVYDAVTYYKSQDALINSIRYGGALGGSTTRVENEAYKFVKSKVGPAILRVLQDVSLSDTEEEVTDRIFYVAEESAERTVKWAEETYRDVESYQSDVRDASRAKRILQRMDLLKVFEDAVYLIDNFEEANKERVVARAEAPEGSMLGRIAFAEERPDVPLEKDNATERAMLKDISRHVGSGRNPLDREVVTRIKYLMSKGLYEKIFKEPTSRIVYRGMTVKSNWIKNAIGVSGPIPDYGDEVSSFTYTPKRGWSSSWSASKKIASEFSYKGEGDYAIILSAYVDENPSGLLDMRGGLYTLNRISEYVREREVIGLGTTRVYRLRWKRR